jgi:M6 family metalloprotease-like protein
MAPRIRLRTLLVMGTVLSLAVVGFAPTSAMGANVPELPGPIDPLSHVLPEHMTWEDYKPVPGYDWTSDAHQPQRKVRAALILGDFTDQPFVVQQQGLTNDPADFYKKFLVTEPSALNHHHTINEYWLEDSFGVVGVDADAFGPYRMAGKLHEYGITSDMNNPAADCPSGDSCNKDLDTDLIEASLADVTTGIATNGGRDYDFRFLLHAGYDESGTWEEFGPMLFPTKESITDDVDPRVGQSLGNPDPTKPNHAKTRYARPDGPWTAFFSAKQPWAHATPGVYSTQGESDGHSTFAHELSHIFGVLDNYGGPFAANADRDYSGPWDMLSRGTFNGPGGPHNRWHIPSNQGATMGAHHMLRTKVRLGFVQPTDVVITTKQALAAGPQIATIVQREQPMTVQNRVNGLKYGFNIALGQDTGDTQCARPGKALCSGSENYDNYTVEVVNRVGYDSFAPDAGVLIAKTKNADTLPFLWVVDAHPDDIGAIDYIKPTGEPQPYRFGDYRQLSDALFKAGTRGNHPDPALASKGYAANDQTTNTFIDAGNDIKFLILDKRTDSAGVLTYRVAVMKATPSPVLAYGATAAAGPRTPTTPGGVVPVTLTVTNTGRATDFFRIAASGSGDTTTRVLNDLVEVAAGASKTVTVYAKSATQACPTVAFTVTSEGDTSKAASATSSCG